MIFVRNGPKFIYILTKKKQEFSSVLVENFKGIASTFVEAMENSGEDDSIVFLLEEDTPFPYNIKNSHNIFLVKTESTLLLASLINNNLTNYINKIHLGPDLLIQKIPPGGIKMIQLLKRDFQAQALTLDTAIEKGNWENTIITFTHSPIRPRLNINNFLSTTLLINQPITKVRDQVIRKAVRYFTEALKNTQWYELRINIFDAEEQYDIHYKRLVTVLEDLDAGLILGEAWTKDHVLTLFSVMAYQVKIMTILDPYELKQILVALEYDSQGNRIVDFDLYFGNRKIQWVETSIHPRKGRTFLGVELREKLFAKLSSETKNKIKSLEKKLTKESKVRSI